MPPSRWANEPPYSDVKADGYVTGAAPDVARAVLKKLGIPELRSQVIMYGAMIPALQARRVDLSTSGLYIKPKRCESIIYSEPDLCGAEAFAVMAGNPFKLKTYEDIAANPEVLMTTCAGCAEEMYALERGVKPEQIKVFTDPPSGIKMLQQGRVNVFALSGTRHPGSAGTRPTIPIWSSSCPSWAYPSDAPALRSTPTTRSSGTPSTWRCRS